jgi:DNA repair protein RecO (recombination protein O)
MDSNALLRGPERGYVLHSYSWRETSLIVEMWFPNYGRIPMVAKGVRRPRSLYRGLLQPFQPLWVDWMGRGELKVLKSVEWLPHPMRLRGFSIFCGFYLNELLWRLLEREDPHPQLFAHYEKALEDLAMGVVTNELILRRFELILVRELGYALNFEPSLLSGKKIKSEDSYVFVPEQGFCLAHGTGQRYHGSVLLALLRGDFSESQTLVQSKGLMRTVLNHLLGSTELNSRRVLQELSVL